MSISARPKVSTMGLSFMSLSWRMKKSRVRPRLHPRNMSLAGCMSR